MVELIPPPNAQALLAPILACLPTAFASVRPPPALLPLLSPILRQRLQISIDRRENWLKLLCWDPDQAEILKDHVENATFEPHPVSGEIEIGEITSITYKRLDEETLKSQIRLEEWPFTPIFLWCSGGDGEDAGWKLAEILPTPEEDDSWSASIAEANESANERIVEEALDQADAAQSQSDLARNNEDDYWALYDQTPSRTPLPKSSSSGAAARQLASEAEYYAQYSSVQPAMDSHDPDEEIGNGIEATLKGDVLHKSSQSQSQGYLPELDDAYGAKASDVPVVHPAPDSPRSRSSTDAIARLEDEAEKYNASEAGIRQHIGTSMKSMYRLAKSIGIERDEFERIVQRELETLSILDRDEL